MFQPHVLFRTLFPILALALLLGGCVMPARQDATPVPPPGEPAVAEPEPEPEPAMPDPVPEVPAEVLTATVTQNANVRTGPGTGNPIAFWLTEGTEVTITGGNEDGTWLQIEHDDRPGWISARLTEIADATAPTVPEPAPTPTPDPTAPTHGTVTGGPISLRVGPGTEYAADGVVDDGQELRLAGRNAQADWLQVLHPTATGELVWLPFAHVQLNAAFDEARVDRLRVVAAPPRPAPTEPAPVAIDNCTQWHTVNPNETWLLDITEWFGLDLLAVARLNRIDPEVPLTVDRVCLHATGVDTSAQAAAQADAQAEDQMDAPARVTATVVGTVVNLRSGPGTNHARAGQVRAGDELDPTGRNADGSWLQVADPNDPARRVWIYGPLTDIDNAAIATLAVVQPTPEPAVQPTPEVSEPTPEPAPQVPAQAAAQPTMPANCTQLHSVNPNESQLVQITNWFGLDVQTVANLNGIDASAPLTAGTQLCLAVDSAPATGQTAIETPATAPAPPAAPVPPGAGIRVQTVPPPPNGQCRSPWGNLHPCPDIPNFPDLAVTSVPDVPVLYHAPGSYDRSEHPGLDYDFEILLGDDSTLWDWHVRDPAACYDALRVHMGGIPESIGLTRLEVRLSDPLQELSINGRIEGYVDRHFTTAIGFPSYTGEEWTPELQATGDLSWVELSCYEEPDAELFCRIYAVEGNSGSIHLAAAVNKTIADSAGHMSRQARTWTLARYHPDVLRYNSFLFPLVDNRKSDPAGFGPCTVVTRAG